MTFHELCLRLGREAGTLGVEPADKTQAWWDEIVPAALDAAIPIMGGRYHAIVVDEGQDFARGWLDSLFLMLTNPEHDVLYVFHYPEQALYREDVVATLGLPQFPIDWNCRNPGPIHRFASRFAPGLASAGVLREEGREPEFIEAAPGHETIEALRKGLHRLRVEQLAPQGVPRLIPRSAHGIVGSLRMVASQACVW